jgi:uncharacterized membrane protein YkoI
MTALIPIVFVLVFGLGMPAMAQDPVITINPDGSIQVHGEMPSPNAPAPLAAPPAAPEPQPLATAPTPERKPDAPANKAQVKKAQAQKPAPKPEPVAAREPIPYRDPAPAYVPPRAVVPDAIPAEGITRDDAKRIALSVAPPSRSVMVYPANMDGHPVFEVVFKTYDGGDYVVLVDQPTGDIIQPQKKKAKKR